MSGIFSASALLRAGRTTQKTRVGAAGALLLSLVFGGCTPDQYDYPVTRGAYIGEVFPGDNSSDVSVGDITLTASSSTVLSEISITLDATESSPAQVLDATLDTAIGGLEERTFAAEFEVDGETWAISGAFLNRPGEDLTDDATTCTGSFGPASAASSWSFAAVFDPTGISGDPVE